MALRKKVKNLYLDVKNPGALRKSGVHLPDFMIIGAMKSGTTSLFNYLATHPDLIPSREKEPSFFSYRYDDVEKYISNFPKASNELKNKYVYEGSVSYIHSKYSARRIYKHLGAIKIITLLRDPIERAVSHYKYYTNPDSTFARKNPSDIETRTIEEAFYDDIKGVNQIWNKQYVRFSLYNTQLDDYYRFFGNNRILVIDFTDLKDKVNKVMKEVSEFLKIDRQIFNDFVRSDEKIESLESFNQTNSKKEFSAYNAQDYNIKLNQQFEEELIGFFRDDVKRLHQRLNKKLIWMERYL